MEGFLQFHQMSKIGFSLPHADNRHPTRCHQSGREEERDENKEDDTGLRNETQADMEWWERWSEREINTKARLGFLTISWTYM